MSLADLGVNIPNSLNQFKYVFAKIIALISLSVLISQFYGILYGETVIVPPKYRIFVILILLFPIVNFIYKWILPRVRNPESDPEKDLTYRDVDFSIYCLIEQIFEDKFLIELEKNRYDPMENLIIGIDRGGSIVGAILAKKLGLTITTLAVKWANPEASKGKTSCVEAGGCLKGSYIDFQNIKRILLVDDAIRTGNTMIIAKALLEKEIGKIQDHNIEYKTACMLIQRPWKKKSMEEIKRFKPDFMVYATKHANINMPWDKEDWNKSDEKNFKQICSKSKIIKELLFEQIP